MVASWGCTVPATTTGKGRPLKRKGAAGAGEEVRGSPRGARGRPPPPPPAARRESPATHDLLAMQAGLRVEDTPTALTLAGTELNCWRGARRVGGRS
jgi:hypothetical protein